LQTVVGVRFKQAGKIYYFGPGDLSIQKDDDVIVETARGIEYGRAVIGPREVEDSAVVLPLKMVQRKATAADRAKVASNAEQEKEAFTICAQKIALHKLPMKLVGVEYTFDINKIIFYFTADGRIDFRELVKDLASVFRTRIELRQIGVRDEAKLMGGIGCCGRPLCCATFLGDFEPVSIRMAKEQNLSLNPTKISGICGRLMCCLKYENDCYCKQCPKKKILPPKQGSRVVSVDGEGKVISLNQQRRTATILLDDRKTIVASWEDIVEKDEEMIGTPAEAAAVAAAVTAEGEKSGDARPTEGSSREKRSYENHSSRENRPRNGHSHEGHGHSRQGNAAGNVEKPQENETHGDHKPQA
jgi:cell fate regulator YaaT (PSP1 superfamily)